MSATYCILHYKATSTSTRTENGEGGDLDAAEEQHLDCATALLPASWQGFQMSL